MEVNNVSNCSFTGVHLNKSKMNNIQKTLSESIARGISYSDEYLDAGERGIDVYLLPGKHAGSVNVRFMDNCSDFFVKQKDSQKILQEEAYSSSNSTIDNILAKIKGILDGSTPRPKYNEDKIVNAQTDLAKLRPEVYEEIFQDARTLDVMDDRTAKMHVWELTEHPDSVF